MADATQTITMTHAEAACWNRAAHAVNPNWTDLYSTPMDWTSPVAPDSECSRGTIADDAEVALDLIYNLESEDQSPSAMLLSQRIRDAFSIEDYDPNMEV